MKTLNVGITDYSEFNSVSYVQNIKKMALFYDRIIVHDLDVLDHPIHIIPRFHKDFSFLQNEIQYLMERNFLVPGEGHENYKNDKELESLINIRNGAFFVKGHLEMFRDNEREHRICTQMEILQTMLELRCSRIKNNRDEFINSSIVLNEQTLDAWRYVLSDKFLLEHKNEPIAERVLELFLKEVNELNSFSYGKLGLARVIINNLPQPNQQTSWDEIWEFKQNSHVQQRFNKLKNWITESTSKNQPISELNEKFNDLLNDYSASLEIAKLKFESQVMQTLVAAIPEFLENLIKLKFGKIAKHPFKIRDERLTFRESELSAEGNEVSYIHIAKQKFE